MAASEFDLWFQLLGPVQARCDGQVLKLGGPKPRAILAALLHRPNENLNTDRLITLVWGPEANVGRESVYHYISGLKAALAPASGQVVLHGLRPDYRLAITEPERVVDWHRFCALLAEATSARQSGDFDDARAVLRHALSLWRGEPLADLGDTLTEFRRKMTTRRIDATEELAELELRHGDPGQVVELLDDLCRQHPERQRAAALLVRSLGAVGRRDDALEVYRRTRTHIVQRLGLDPDGPLEAAYRVIVGNGAPSANQLALRSGLPRLTGHFVGRHAELARLRDVLSRRSTAGEASGGAVICTIDGMAGIGKTELALRAAHAIADQFPDGALFFDLRGYTPDADPLEPADVLARLLERLGVAADRIPYALDDRATVYRATLADRAVLIILDNARDSRQVQPLLPAAPASRVIVTSRRQLTALDDTVTVRLDVLDPDDASQLLLAVAGLPAGAKGAAVVSRIVSRCGQVPLAIRIIGARYRDRAWSTLEDLDAQLADEHDRLGLMDDGDRSVTAAFAVSYQSLPDDQRRMFRLLGLVPGPGSDVDLHDAAALAGITVHAAQQLLGRLYANGLLTQPSPGHYGLHDLLRDYAAHVAQAEPEPDRGALTRLLDHYSHTASLAMGLNAPFEPHRRPPTPPPVAAAPPLADKAQADAWLNAHQHALVAAARYAATHGWPTHTTHLSSTLFRYLQARLRYGDALDLYSVALSAARLTGDRRAEAHVLNDLANVHFRHHNVGQALEDLQRALAIDRGLQDRSGEARTLGNLATVHGGLGHYQEAIEHHQNAVRLFVELGDRTSEERATVNLCSTYLRLGQDDTAIQFLERVLGREPGDPAVRGSGLAVLANAYRERGRLDEALEHHERALALQRETDTHELAETLNDLAQTLRDRGRHDEALTRYREALAHATRADDRTQVARARDGIAGVQGSAGGVVPPGG